MMPSRPEGGPFARLAELVRSNDVHLEELAVLNGRLAEAREYLATPSCNVALGRAQYRRIRDRRALVLTALRANRLASREFLAS
jgi:hypothetical protein